MSKEQKQQRRRINNQFAKSSYRILMRSLEHHRMKPKEKKRADLAASWG
jgi:hypothetical protein